jgi:H+/gluconate symporter-like permease
MEKIGWKYEIISIGVVLLVIVLILPLFKVEPHVIYLASIIVGVEVLMLVGIKIYFFKQKMDFKNSIDELMDNFSKRAGSIVNPLFNKISTMKEPEYSHANKIINDAYDKLKKYQRGIFT